ncbi:MAG: AMP-binding protein [Clostridia bacterium]|nr:AMP-binding protein [Clostridia bacterium]
MSTVKYNYYDVPMVSNMEEMIALALKECPDKIVYKYKVKDEIRSMTYEAFVNRVYALGAYLTAAGEKAGHIACLGANSVNWITAYFTALRSSGVFIPLDKELPEKDLIHLLNDSKATVLFYDKRYEKMLKENLASLGGIKLFIGFDRTENEDNFISFEKALDEGAALDKAEYIACKSDPNAMKMLVYTSGTTGMSKGVMLSEKNLMSCVCYGLQVSTVFDVGLSVLPYSHTYESVADLLVSFHHHSTLCINESLKAVLKNLQTYQPEYIYIVPAIAELFVTRITREIEKQGKAAMFAKLIKASNFLRKIGIDKRRTLFGMIHKNFGGKLKKIVCGGAAIRPEVGEFFDNIGISLINGYGITECSPLVCANHDAANDYHTAGIKLRCIDWRIDDPDEEGIGEICIKGDTVMLGYYNRPDLTAEVIQDGWFYTGDYGYINSKEQLVICGRKKNVIVLDNGKNIYPEEIEGYIQGIDFVTEVVVTGENNEASGNAKSLVAEVFLSENKSPAEVLKSIKNACKELPIYKQISNVIIRDKEFEKTTSNKIKRFVNDKTKKN